MVELAAPDLERYPRFAQALAAAQTAELGPGDAVFIPNLCGIMSRRWSLSTSW